ncbi:MAG: S-layer homology domain-containing protein, partial [Armatimonadota bacterium]|nr:S-layer homology domain-containing protein [Armatimonadota bacterium]
MSLRKRAPWLWLLAAGVLGLSSPTEGAATRPVDVPGDHWAAAAIAELTSPEMRLIELFGNGTFRGYVDLQRYDLVKSLDNLVLYLQQKGVRVGPGGAIPTRLPYTDVPSDHFANRSIRRLLWAIPGDKNLFRGKQTCTRLDMAVWLYQIFKDLPQAANLQLGPIPPDVDPPFATPARWALAAGPQGLLSRYPDGRFHPNRSLTRYELAYSMDQVLKWLTAPPPPPPPAVTDNAQPQIAVFEPEVEGARDFVVVAKKKQMVVAGIAADDTGVVKVTVNQTEATLAFADEADLKKAGLTGPAAVWFRTQIPAPGEGGSVTIVATDRAGKSETRVFRLKAPNPDSPQVIQTAHQPQGTQRVARKWALLIGVN